jgi:threonine dehydrogenase-like Zn-dependent dehydrogenase
MPTHTLPTTSLAWPFRGRGLASLGVDGQPVVEPMPACGPEQVLVRVDALGLCASDAKMVRMGQDYPLFFPRDFDRHPARLGHEAALTVIEVGERWRSHFEPGQRLGVQANVYNHGLRTIFGVNLPGAMAQYLTLDEAVLAGDEGSYVFPVPDSLTYVDIALLEPWSCVDVAYTPVRRLELKRGGALWICGRPGGPDDYVMSRPLPSARAVLTDVPARLAAWVKAQPVETVEGEPVPAEHFDDIILLDPERAGRVAQAAEQLAHAGMLTLVTRQPLDAPVDIDVGRLHYEPLSVVGCTGPDIATAYGVARNRSELRTGGVTLIVGAGGTLGRIHTQRALQLPDGPAAVIVTNRGQERLRRLAEDFGPRAAAAGRELVAVSPAAEPGRLEREIDRLTGGRGCDDVVVVVPDAAVIAQAARHMAPDGMLVVFAGLPVGSKAPLPLDWVALHGAQFTGTSGSTLADELDLLGKVGAGILSPSGALAAIGGMRAMAAGVEAVMTHVYPGKVVIFPQLVDLSLLALPELHAGLPSVAVHLGPGDTWTAAAERALFELCPA